MKLSYEEWLTQYGPDIRRKFKAEKRPCSQRALRACYQEYVIIERQERCDCYIFAFATLVVCAGIAFIPNAVLSFLRLIGY